MRHPLFCVLSANCYLCYSILNEIFSNAFKNNKLQQTRKVNNCYFL